jgi:hypothetical protein
MLENMSGRERPNSTRYSTTRRKRSISSTATSNKEIKLSFNPIVATVNGALHRSTINCFSAVVTTDSDRKNREDTLRAKPLDIILRSAYRRLQRIQFQAPTVYHHSAQKKRKRNE